MRDEVHAMMRAAMNLTQQAEDGSYRVAWDFMLTVGTNTASTSDRPPAAKHMGYSTDHVLD